jgi:hypothetical protein
MLAWGETSLRMLGRRQGVAVVRVIEEEPGAGRAQNEFQHAAIGEEPGQAHAPSALFRGVLGVNDAFGEDLQLGGGFIGSALNARLESRGLGHIGAQVDHGGGWDGAQGQQDPPGQDVAHARREQHQRH